MSILEGQMSISPVALVPDDVFFPAVYNEAILKIDDFAREVARLKARRGTGGDSRLIELTTSIVALAARTVRVDLPDEATLNEAAMLRQLECLVDDMAASQEEILRRCARDLRTHLRYREEHDDGNPLFLHEMMVNCVTVICALVFSGYRRRSDDPRRSTPRFDVTVALAGCPDPSRELMDRAAAELQGWCSPVKAALLYSLVRQYKPDSCVEVGIYGGRSIIPIATALRDNQMGHVTGIETWSGTAATRFRTSIGNDIAWAVADYGSIKRAFLRFILDQELADVVRVIEADSSRAHSVIDNCDFLHIDGGHSVFGAAQDVIVYLPKLRRGGVVVFDDIDWESTGPALEILLSTCQLISVVGSQGKPETPGCAAFLKL